MIKKLPKKNQKYYVLDSEVIGLRIYVQITGEKSFYLQRYLKEFKYSKKSKIGDFPEMSISAARKLAALIKADNVQGKDLAAAGFNRVKNSKRTCTKSQNYCAMFALNFRSAPLKQIIKNSP